MDQHCPDAITAFLPFIASACLTDLSFIILLYCEIVVIVVNKMENDRLSINHNTLLTLLFYFILGAIRNWKDWHFHYCYAAVHRHRQRPHTGLDHCSRP